MQVEKRTNNNAIADILRFFGRLAALFMKWKNPSEIFMFFPFYHVGGAEKVHAEIVVAIEDNNPWIFITNRSKNKKYKKDFYNSGRVFDLWKLISSPSKFLKSNILAGFVAKQINCHEHPLVFGSNSDFFYQLIPLINDHARIIDLIHAFSGNFEYKSLPLVNKLTLRVVVNKKIKDEFGALYLKHNIDPGFLNRIRVVNNYTNVPVHFPDKPQNQRLKVLYVGRGAPEKQIHLIGQIAHFCAEKDIKADFSLIGDVDNYVNDKDKHYCQMLGLLTNEKEINSFYIKSDILILTSSREGLPLVVLDAMAYGVIPITTPVGGIPELINDNVDGVIIKGEHDREIIKNAAAIIENLERNRQLLKKLSINAYNRCKDRCSKSEFTKSYRKILLKCY